MSHDFPPEVTPRDLLESGKFCIVCATENLSHHVNMGTCQRCGEDYCEHFRSRVDPQYCVECMGDIELAVDVIVRRDVYVNKATHEETVRTKKATRYKFEGKDWMFAQRSIAELGDGELRVAIEYHRNLMGLIANETTTRMIAKAHRYSGVKFTPPVKDTLVGSETVKKTTRSSAKKSGKGETNINAVAALLGKLSPEMLAAVLAKAQGK